MMNQLQAVALNEGLRCKKQLWRETRTAATVKRQVGFVASRQRRDLLELMDPLNPTIAELGPSDHAGATTDDASRSRCSDSTGLRADYWQKPSAFTAVSRWRAT
jgi:hypothetical protein